MSQLGEPQTGRSAVSGFYEFFLESVGSLWFGISLRTVSPCHPFALTHPAPRSSKLVESMSLNCKEERAWLPRITFY